MPEGPLFAPSDGDGGYGASNGGTDGNADSGQESAAAAATDSKNEIDVADSSAVEHCQPTPAKKSSTTCSVDTIKKNLDARDGGTNAWANAKNAAGKDPTVQVKKTQSGFEAETVESTITITIAPASNCCDATESLLFELHGYARAEEHVEYDGLKRSWETFDKCKWGCGAGALRKFQSPSVLRAGSG